MSTSGGKRADPSTQCEVDEMILDYVLAKSIEALNKESLATHKDDKPCVPDTSEADVALAMVDCELGRLKAYAFLVLFKSNHPNRVVHPALRFRLRLVKFLAIYTRRLFPSSSAQSMADLEHLRQQNDARTRKWLSLCQQYSSVPSADDPRLTPFASSLPLSEHDLRSNRYRALSAFGLQDQMGHYGCPASTTLLDMLPAFMYLSASIVNTIDTWTVGAEWVDTAAGFILQAVLEQYLIYGNKGAGPLREAFAWGFNAQGQPDHNDDEKVNAMFRCDEEATYPIWGEIKADRLKALLPRPQIEASIHLEGLATRFPMKEFSRKLLGYLADLSRLPARPALVQLESGKLDGLSREETKALRERVGL
ncbi:MAG: hypothetical protein M1833_004698 [Piccolia ochrophora]|nr:MAG: hypothetical protein M1833_004698 [Piccolia ochrophora]